MGNSSSKRNTHFSHSILYDKWRVKRRKLRWIKNFLRIPSEDSWTSNWGVVLSTSFPLPLWSKNTNLFFFSTQISLLLLNFSFFHVIWKSLQSSLFPDTIISGQFFTNLKTVRKYKCIKQMAKNNLIWVTDISHIAYLIPSVFGHYYWTNLYSMLRGKKRSPANVLPASVLARIGISLQVWENPKKKWPKNQGWFLPCNKKPRISSYWHWLHLFKMSRIITQALFTSLLSSLDYWIFICCVASE